MTLRRFFRDRVSLCALLLFLLICAITLAGVPLLEHVGHADPYRQDAWHDYAPPSPEHWAGTDALGRDVLIRLVFAGQASLQIGFAVAGLDLVLGVVLGLLAGYWQGWVDDLVNAVALVRSGIPTLYLLILLAVVFHDFVSTPAGLAITFGLLGWSGNMRQVRGLVLSLKQREFVEAARAVGATEWHIMARHILPNMLSILLVAAGFDMIGAMMGEAGLSYLGLGIQPPAASWGNMLYGALEQVERAPWLVVLPGLAISATVGSLFILTDGLRDALDPRLSTGIRSE